MGDLKALLVDDEEEFISALAERLNLRGINTSYSCSGEEALKMIDADPPDVVLLDKLMPGLSGDEILARIRATHPRVAVIFLTGHGCLEEEGAAAELCDYLMKPVNIDELIRKIRLAVTDSR